jgi:hypothetical protein
MAVIQLRMKWLHSNLGQDHRLNRVRIDAAQSEKLSDV